MGGSDEERALRRKKRKSKEDDRFIAVKSAIIKRLGDTCDVSVVWHRAITQEDKSRCCMASVRVVEWFGNSVGCVGTAVRTLTVGRRRVLKTVSAFYESTAVQSFVAAKRWRNSEAR